MTAAFLAEGPGGFMESFAKFRADAGAKCDRLHGITLLSRNRNIPNWKVQRVCPPDRVTIHRGADGTGDLYQVRNIDHLVAEVGQGACDLVTADGGFDFSSDFNNQEEASMRLILSEVYTALRLQRPGGAFLLKVYDVHAIATMRILFALRTCYAAVRIVKPLTSRPANSEKYVMCTGFRGLPPALRSALRAACVGGGGAAVINTSLRPVAPLPVAFVRDIVHFNTMYVARQVAYIGRTILLIVQDADRAPHAHHRGLHVQLSKSLRWCHKYGIRACVRAVRSYAPLLSGGGGT